MPVFIYQDDALEKLCIVEGADFARWSDDPSECSFGSNLSNWKKSVGENPHPIWLDPDVANTTFWGRPGTSEGVLYGLWGWHRYLVFCSGEIVFLRYFCEITCVYWKEHLELARKMGFRISPDDMGPSIFR